MNASKSLKIAMIRRGLGQAQMGAMLGISQAAMSRLSNRPNWTCESLQKVSDALGMKVSEFVKIGEE